MRELEEAEVFAVSYCAEQGQFHITDAYQHCSSNIRAIMENQGKPAFLLVALTTSLAAANHCVGLLREEFFKPKEIKNAGLKH